MFEVLAYVYKNYSSSQACPELLTLHRKLHALGFPPQEVDAALLWLEDLKHATQRQNFTDRYPSSSTRRLFTPHEQDYLGTDSWGFLTVLADIGALSGEQLELVLERALATPGNPVGLDDLKLIVLMVFWGLGQEPVALVLDELCGATAAHWLH